jgi:hypothetical protein
MRYASTREAGGAEAVAVVLPLGAVPLWSPESPLPGTYLVPDDVEAGWVRDPETGAFAPPVVGCGSGTPSVVGCGSGTPSVVGCGSGTPGEGGE